MTDLKAAVQYFYTLSHKRYDFRGGGGGIRGHKVCFFLYIFDPKYFSLEEEWSEIWSEMYIGLHVKYPLLFLLDFNET
jgi:hypothetical protein